MLHAGVNDAVEVCCDHSTLTMRHEYLAPYREPVVSEAKDRVLEIGVGAGENLPRYYGAIVSEVIGLEPSAKLAAIAKAAIHAPVKTRLIEASLENISLEDRSVNTVVLIWRLCSIADPLATLREMPCALRAERRLLFAEH